jgi:uncharacterized repeat protein (TIGR03803 family)
MRKPFLRFMSKLSLVTFLVFAVVSGGLARGREQTLYVFPGGRRGDQPQTGVVFDKAGHLYGTTYYGGAYGWGTVFELKHSQNDWQQEVLYSFMGGSDGSNPTGNLLIDDAGNLYGTTLYGGTGAGCQQGSYECGTVFEVVRSDQGWKHSVLYSFCPAVGCSDGSAPSGLSFDKAGNLYGTTGEGGGGCPSSGCGTVYELTRSNRGWTETVLHAFSQSGDGFSPGVGVTLDNLGNVYGTTSAGGTSDWGIVFELKRTKTQWTELVLYSFAPGYGGANGGLTLGAAGVIFGTTQGGVFELRRSHGRWNETMYYPAEGANPKLVLDKTGALYGTAILGGAWGNGFVFRMHREKQWQIQLLHSFVGGSDGANPAAGLILGADGKLYGTTSSSYGSQYGGTVFQIIP